MRRDRQGTGVCRSGPRAMSRRSIARRHEAGEGVARGYRLFSFRFSRIFITMWIGEPTKPNSSRIRRSRNRR